MIQQLHASEKLQQELSKKKQKELRRQKEKKQDNFEIDLCREDPQQRTTVMVRNIPNKFTKKLLLKEFEQKFKDRFDFFYLPIDFSNNINMGYAFVNFKSVPDLKAFHAEFNGKKWNRFNSEKVCSVTYAKIQGKAKCKKIFKDSLLLEKGKKFRPYITREPKIPE